MSLFLADGMHKPGRRAYLSERHWMPTLGPLMSSILQGSRRERKVWCDDGSGVRLRPEWKGRLWHATSCR